MKKIVLLSLVTLITLFLGASEPKRTLQKPVLNKSGISVGKHYSRNNKPSSQRSGSLQKVLIGKAGNLLTILNANCHQLDADSTLNTVIFTHRSDTVVGTSYNVAQYRYDISTNGGTTWTDNIGPLNPRADNITINGRYPQAVIYQDSANPTTVDSSYIVYNGSWWTGSGSITNWQGQYYGVGRLDRDTSTYTDHPTVENNANMEIATSMIQSTPGHFWNVNLNYTEISTTLDTIRGIVLESGVWSDSAHEVLWTYRYINIGSALIYDASGNVTGNVLFNPIISFDPTGQYGWILLEGDITNDNYYTISPIYMQSSDFGQTWSAPQALPLDNLPGMFPTPSNATNGAKSVIGDAQVTVDSAGNPHIAAIIGICDTTSNQYSFFPLQPMVLYDLYYNPAVVGCSWQANYLSKVFGFNGVYTSDNVGDNNRVQMSRTKDGKKIFVFWNDTDSAEVASIAANSTGTTAPATNPNPNLLGIGIDMVTRQLTNVKDFTSGDALFGGQITSLGLVNGTFGGALFPDISPNVLNLSGGNYNIPATLTQPDYLNSNVATWSSINPAQFYYCQNINFSQSDFVNRFDNAPPTLTVNGPDTVYVHLDSAYVHPTATAYDCIYGNIIPQYSSNVPTDVNGKTDSIGIFASTWTASNPSGNSSSQTQVVIVTIAPVARFVYVPQSTARRYLFIDSSLYYPTNRDWAFGDQTQNLNNVKQVIHTYTSNGIKCVILKVSNPFGTSSDTQCINVTGLNDVELANKIYIYPNPSSGIISVDIDEDIAQGEKVSVLNLLGQQVNPTYEIKPSVTQTTLDLSNLATGVYVLKVETLSGTAVKEIVINK
jgi:hypothetical protein